MTLKYDKRNVPLSYYPLVLLSFMEREIDMFLR